MEKEREVLAAESEALSLVKKNFRRESGSSVRHIYNLGTHLMIQIKKIFVPPTFPQSSGKFRATKGDIQQRMT